MAQIIIALAKTDTNLPSGVTFAGTNVVVTDSTGQPQPAVMLTGKETPPWTMTATVADGAGTVAATDVDTAGVIMPGTTVRTEAYTTIPVPSTFPATTGISISNPVLAATAAAAKKA
jgi:hypothetical protein